MAWSIVGRGGTVKGVSPRGWSVISAGGVVKAAATATTTQTFGTISVSGQSDVVADAAADTLTLAAGSNITLTTNASTDTVTIAAAAGGSLTLGTETSLSSTSVTFTGIPAGTKEIYVMLTAMSTNGAVAPEIRLGTSGGIVATGYLSTRGVTTSGGAAGAAGSTAGFTMVNDDASRSWSGMFTLTLMDGTNHDWTCHGATGTPASVLASYTSGWVSLGAELTQLQINSLTNSFDTGSINISYA